MKETKQILIDIAKGNFAPVYLLMGKEPFFIDQISNALITHVVEESAKDFDMTLMYGKETQADQVIEAAKRFPMMGKHQLIVIKEAQYLERQLDALTPYIENPQQQTVLVVCYKYKKLDKRKASYKAFARSGVVLESKTLYENQTALWIEQQAATYGFTLHPKSIPLLLAYLGTDLGKIDKAFIKLSHNLSKGSEITPSIIELNIGISKEFNSFELQLALAHRNLAQAYRIINYMASNPTQHPLVLTLSVIFNFYQKLFMFHGVNSPSKAASILGVSPYFIKDYQAASKKYSMKQTAKVLQILSTYDLKSKGLGAANISMLELLKEMTLKIVSI